MNLDTAKSTFLEVIQNLTDFERPIFVKWLKKDILEHLETENNRNQIDVVESRLKLRDIAEELKGKVPLEATLASENIVVPADFLLESGPEPDQKSRPKPFVHLDSFLYDEEDEQRLEEEGKLTRHFCRDCQSKNTEPIEFITHSCSRTSLEFMFTTLLPPLDNKRVLDVGSRLGAVLYGAFYFSTAKEIYGIEINQDFCDLATATAEKYGMSNRVKVMNSELTSVPELVGSMDVVVLNNVFDWFMPKDTQVQMWQFLRTYVPKGALIVSSPAIHEALAKIQTNIDVESWVRRLNPTRPDQFPASDLEEESNEIHLYQVL